MITVKERRKIKAVKRSQMATNGYKKKVKSADDLERLERYRQQIILFRKFN